MNTGHMPACESCRESGTLLFTCEHCGEQFCLDHQFPHHACAKFSSGGTTDASEGAAGRPAKATAAAVPGSTTTGSSTSADSSSSSTPESSTTETTGTSTETTSGSTTGARPGPASGGTSSRAANAGTPVARDAARETRPDRSEPSPSPPVRGMPWERAGETPIDWMQKQSLPGYVLKVGVLSLLFNLAYFGGLAAVVYGWL